ncbi:hypothetical protein J4471_00115 [Candidatus Woesearchaeota archaeon]|nr:hypothetical protein [Candidatus Woesearchaeota archaeon]
MPIDDQIRKMHTDKDNESNKSQDLPQEDYVLDALMSYSHEILNLGDSELLPKHVQKIKLNGDNEFKMLESLYCFLKFRPGLKHILGCYDPSNMIEIALDADSDFSEHSEIPNIEKLCSRVVYPIPGNEKFVIPKILNYPLIQAFNDLTNHVFIIPDLTFLSLFISDGFELSSVSQSFDERDKPILFLTNDVKHMDMTDILNFDNITKYLKKPYSSQNLSNMIEQTLDLVDYIRSTRDSQKLRKGLYEKLTTFHPELTINY